MSDPQSTSPNDHLQGWFAGRLPDGWFAGPLSIDVDRDEILVIGTLAEPELPNDATSETRSAALAAGSPGSERTPAPSGCRSPTRPSGGSAGRCPGAPDAAINSARSPRLSMPAMTRLRMPERKVLDTLVDSGVARSRSHALAWCVRLIAERQEEWLKDLREALRTVEQVRADGPHD